MKFKINFPPPVSQGIRITEPVQVVPNQSLSLQEILERFTRNESLPIGHDTVYHESDDDIEKVQHLDLVDRAEFVEKLNETKKKYDTQEKAREKKRREKLEAEEREKIKQELEKELSQKAQKKSNGEPSSS